MNATTLVRALVLLALAPVAFGQSRLSPEERAAALAAIEEQVQKFYVFPEQRAGIVDALGQARRAGRFDLDSPTAFADAVTEVLHATSRDGHLGLRYDPRWYAEATAPAGGAEDLAAVERRWAARDHHGLQEQRLLPGNMRYLKITGFPWTPDETGAAYDAAMRFLKDGDAIILDLRGNGGGDHAATRYLISHFLDGDVPLYTFLSQKGPATESRTLDYLPAGRLKGKPLYVLIDRGVRSAGEDVAYQVQQYKLGELVGATTAGAANNNEHVAIAPGFRLSLSIGRPVHPLSHGNWEGAGVPPTFPCPPAEALERAQMLALERLAQRATGDADPLSRAEIAWALQALEARLHPVTLPAARLRALAGTFGPVTVTLRDDALWIKRPDLDWARLVPMSDGVFMIEGRDGLRVLLTPASLGLQALGAPEPRTFPRS
jgi:hypothetical protein